jgi:hypothetical protein
MLRHRNNGLRGASTTIQKYWILILPLFLLLPGLFAFPYPSPQAEYSDLAITHYPNAVYLLRAIETWHTLPLWSPTILSGYPFAANPLAGIWYLPGWLAYLLPLPFGFNLLIGLHLLLGGIGMYKLLLAEGLEHRSALFGALAFEAMPKLFAHYGAGHLTLLYAIPWTPWLLLAWRAPGLLVQVRRWMCRVPSGLILALIFLADVRWAAYSGLLWLGYALIVDPVAWPGQRSGTIVQRLKSAGWQLTLAVLIAAPLAFPLWEYSQLSTRSEMVAQDIFTFSLPPARLLGMIVPDFGGFQEFTLYPGMVVFIMAVLAGLLGVAHSRSKFWLWVAGISLFYALGDHIPLLVYAARLPGFDLLRVPSRSLFVSGIAMIFLASYTLDKLLLERVDPSSGFDRERRRTRLFLAGLFAFVLLVSAVVWWLTAKPPINFIWSCVMTAGVWIGYEILVGKRLAPRSIYWVLIGLCLLDLGIVDLKAYSPRPVEVVLAEGRAVLESLPVSDQQYRIFSPSYSAPQQTAAQIGLELADGVDPLQLQKYFNFMKLASGISWNGYSVTLPAYPNGNPHSDNSLAQLDSALLGLLNVRYILSAFELDTPGLLSGIHLNGAWIYENQQALPRAWLQPPSSSTGEDIYPLKEVDWSPNRITVTVPTQGVPPENQRLVLSELFYPGWQVTVDGKSERIELEAGLLRSVVVPAGTHEVIFTFHPTSLILGLVAAGFGWLLALFSGSWQEQTWDADSIGK